MSAASVKKIAPTKNVRFVTTGPDRVGVERHGADREEDGPIAKPHASRRRRTRRSAS